MFSWLLLARYWTGAGWVWSFFFICMERNKCKKQVCRNLCRVYTCRFDNQVPKEKLV